MQGDRGGFHASVAQLQKKAPSESPTRARHFRCTRLQGVHVLVITQSTRGREIAVTDRLSDAINRIEKLSPALREPQFTQTRNSLIPLKDFAAEVLGKLHDQSFGDNILGLLRRLNEQREPGAIRQQLR